MKYKRAEPGFDPGTSRTLSGNHTTRPHDRWSAALFDVCGPKSKSNNKIPEILKSSLKLLNNKYQNERYTKIDKYSLRRFTNVFVQKHDVFHFDILVDHATLMASLLRQTEVQQNAHQHQSKSPSMKSIRNTLILACAYFATVIH